MSQNRHVFGQRLRPRQRTDTSKPKRRYNLRVERKVLLPQPELEAPYQSLVDNTSNLVNYRKMGKLSTTVAELDPIIRQVCDVTPRGGIDKEAAQDLEAELRDAVERDYFIEHLAENSEEVGDELYDAIKDVYFGDIVVKTDPIATFDLYGKAQNRLAICLDQDVRLGAERGAIETYLQSAYGIPSPVMKKMLKDFDPHITIGTVRYENFDNQDAIEEFKVDPLAFLARYAYRRSRDATLDFDTDTCKAIIVPDVIALDGLKIGIEERIRTRAH
jgi:hypothetical protein